VPKLNGCALAVLREKIAVGDQEMGDFWRSVTAPQATIIAAALTVFAAIVGVALGWWLFSGRVRSLKEALDKSDELLRRHAEEVAGILAEVRQEVASSMEGLGQLRGTVGDLQIASASEGVTEGQLATRDEVQGNWNAIRDRLERIATEPAIDGRTRAKFARIDRRRYADLVDALAAKGLLDAHEGAFTEAVNLWQRYRNGKTTPTKANAARMAELREQLVPPDAEED
jgi:hypothetical protein